MLSLIEYFYKKNFKNIVEIEAYYLKYITYTTETKTPELSFNTELATARNCLKNPFLMNAIIKLCVSLLKSSHFLCAQVK